MAPSTSPGKTWEGFIFGTAATIFVSFVALYKQDFLSIWQSIALGVALAFAAPLGDLYAQLDDATAIGADRHAGILQRFEIAIDGAQGDAEPVGELLSGDPRSAGPEGLGECEQPRLLSHET